MSEREILELHGPWFQHPETGLFVDYQKLPKYLPCPICNGVEGCDHSWTERARAAKSRRKNSLQESNR
jgi:hypothetical protein